MDYHGVKIERLGHSGFKITAGLVVYIDPFHIQETEPADLLLLTHEHYDHLSIEDIRKILRPTTTILCTGDCLSKLTQFERNPLKVMKAGASLEADGVTVEAVEAYNLNKFRAPGIPFHPQEDEKLGYILTLKGVRIYHAGDTDVIPEMKKVRNIDVALLPVSGTYVMTPQEAAEAVRILKPKLAIPMHYGAIVGSEKDAQRFKSLVKGTPVEIL